ncbi:alpha/beta hydrolase-fold protein [Gracilibacillus sp. JCM 18860]|uniref:alpha/beta hydrolase-fold protein n=1 Tax=Gracilibacillus sp. JCM 18860 TaxID=1306159 RepID=UPI0006D0FA23
MKRKGKMEDLVIESQYLQEALTVKIYVPEGFSPFHDYQLCIMQDGDDYFRIGRIATLSDQLHASMEIEPTIFIGIHYQDRYDRLDKYHPDGKLQKKYIDFLIREVIPSLEEKLHITPPLSYTLMGDSLAGTLAFMIASSYPSTINKVVMQSPFVNETVLKKIRETNQLQRLKVYHSVGTEETDVKITTGGEVLDFLAENRTFQHLLANKVSDYTYEEFNGDHTWTYWQQDLRKILIHMLGE